MPQLIKNIEATIYQPINGDLNTISLINGYVQIEDYINLFGFICYLQNLTKVEDTYSLIQPLSFGLTNEYNISPIELDINY